MAGATSTYLNNPCRSRQRAALDIAAPLLQRVSNLLNRAAPAGEPGDDYLNTRGHAEIAALQPLVARGLADIETLMAEGRR